MDYVNFGSSGLKVSRIALGLGFRGQRDATEAQRVIEHAVDSGVNLIDCANMYGLMDDRSASGSSEEILGRVLAGRRDDIVITSKVSSQIGEGPNDGGSSRFHIMREVERSLRRLRTDHIDVYLLHHFDTETPLEESVRALDDLVRQGKVRYAGCCNFAAWQACRGLWIADRINAAPFVSVQNPYSLLNRSLEAEMFGLARATGLGIMAYSPLGVGLLSGAYVPGETPQAGTLWGDRRRHAFAAAVSGVATDVLRVVRSVAADGARSPAQVAVNWVLSHPEITVAISGADTIQQLDDVVSATGWSLTAEERTRLDDVSAPMHEVLDGAGFE